MTFGRRIRIDSFFSHSGIATIARNSSIKKAKGYSALTFFLNIFVLPFIGKNIYRSIVINPKSGFLAVSSG
jgi:hypothetical protein